jgi:hypothetical protein
MRLTDVTAFSWISYIFTTLSYVAWQVGLKHSYTVSTLPDSLPQVDAAPAPQSTSPPSRYVPLLLPFAAPIDWG